MEDSSTETDRGGNTSNDLTVSSGDTISQTTTKKFGDYARNFELANAEFLYHNDELETDINGADAQLTVCTWFNPTSTDQGHLIGKYSSEASDTRQYGLYISASIKYSFYTSANGSSGEAFDSSTAPVSGTFVHVCGVYDDVNKYIYINGASTSTSKTTGIYDGTAKFSFANRNAGIGYQTNGIFDDAAVFSSALDATDINDIMTNGLVQAGASGWSHNFMGVPNANISSINGVPIANIQRVNGVQ